MTVITRVPPCPVCGDCHLPTAIEANLNVCPGCGHHYRISARRRVEQLVDPGSFEEWDEDLRPADPLEFEDVVPYRDRLVKARRTSGMEEAVLSGAARLDGWPIGIAVMDFAFIGGSMGEVVGERVARAMERSASRNKPFVAITSSGGARMQEGILSLMQLAKTSIARTRLAEVPVPYISVLSDPTMGGVMASFAGNADVILAEPRATIGFAGARVIQQATHEDLPHAFQTSEFMMEHGMVDKVVSRHDLRTSLSRLLALYPAARENSLQKQA
jgi:acetyl-CoA carboxylase carboxyl transferase subunit beta